MKILLSIKPQYVEKIFNGEKKYEYRRKIFKNDEVNHVIIYCSSPIKKVVGEFNIDTILKLSPDILWKETKKQGGISERDFYNYFDNCDSGYAIKIKNVRQYKSGLDIKKYFGINPPQSFAYMV